MKLYSVAGFDAGCRPRVFAASPAEASAFAIILFGSPDRALIEECSVDDGSSEKEIERLRGELKEEQDRAEANGDERDKFKEERDNLESRLKTTEANAKELEGQLDKLRRDYDALESLHSKVDPDRETAKAELHREVADANARAEKAEKAQKKLEAQLTRIRKALGVVNEPESEVAA